MAFNPSNLSISIESGLPGQPNCMDYTTSDTIATAEGSSYFSDNRFFRTYNLLRITANDGKGIYDIVSLDPVGLRKLAVVTSFSSL